MKQSDRAIRPRLPALVSAVSNGLRRRWHPLHVLRTQVWFRWLLKWIDWTMLLKVGLRRPVALRWITHAPLYLIGYRLEPNIHRIFDEVLGELGADEPFFDLGANVGLYSWAALDRRPQLRVVSIEPDPTLIKLIRRTSRAWRTEHHQIIEAAVSDSEGEGGFERDEITTATGRLCIVSGASFQRTHFNSRGRVVAVRLITIDNLARRFGRPGLIKLDVEGHELAALRGAAETLSDACPPTILVESFSPAASEMREVLRRYGYDLFDADACGLVTPQSTNFLAVHPARRSNLAPHLRSLGLPLGSA